MKVNILKALADPTRLSLLGALGKGELCACILPAMVKKSQPTVSLHLGVLLKAGLVDMRKDGARHLYSLSPAGRGVLKDISGW